MAASKADHIPELLEQFLVHLLIKDIFKARGVCRRWKETIEISDLLKRRTFRKLQKDQPLTFQRIPTDAHWCPHLMWGDELTEALVLPRVSNRELRLNPLFWTEYGFASPAPIKPYFKVSGPVKQPTSHKFRERPLYFVIPRTTALSEIQGSVLRDMYMTEPPIPVCYIGLRHRTTVDTVSAATVRDDQGVKLGLMLEVFQKLLHSVASVKMDDWTCVAGYMINSPRYLIWWM